MIGALALAVGCTIVTHHGTKVVTVRGTHIVTVDGRPKRVVYKHRKRVVYSWTEQKCPPPFGGHMSRALAGYVWPSNSTVTGIGATWTVPTLDCKTAPSNGGVVTSIGTGGNGSGDLLEAGVVSTCVDGVQNNSAFWQVYPSSGQGTSPCTVDACAFLGLRVTAGETIKADISDEGSGIWLTEVADESVGLGGIAYVGDPGAVFGVGNLAPSGWVAEPSGLPAFTTQGTTDISYAGGTTGEWMVGDSSQSGPTVAFSTITFSNMGLSPAWDYGAITDEWEIVGDGQVLAAPSFVGSDLQVTFG